MKSHDRRSFLKNASVLGAAGLTSPWALNLATMGTASAQSSALTDYKALVCIFMAGGNDAHNTVLNTETSSTGAWYYYRAARDPSYNPNNPDAAPVAIQGTTSIALNKAEVLAITQKNGQGLNAGRQFGLHPQLKRTRQMYADGKAAIVANVGPLIQPTIKFDLTNPSFPLPQSLMSHNDQQSTWQSFAPEGSVGGWGGLMMDQLMSRNVNATFSSIGVNSGPVWLAGNVVSPYQIGTSGVRQMAGAGATFGSQEVYQAVRRIASTSYRSETLANDHSKTVARALSVEGTLLSALPSATMAPWGTPGAATSASDPLLKYVNPNTGVSTLNPLALQLQMVVRMIHARKHAQVGVRRQVFMVNLGGFDTHSEQPTVHADLMAQLDHAVGYFYDALAAMPGGEDLRSQVTSFTASDFGRALNNNGDGTDHGWGGHHFVFGASVKGGDVYGRFPDFRPFDNLSGGYFSSDFLTNGVLLPEVSVDQFAYTLGQWMDVSVSALTGTGGTAGITPHILNFDTSVRNLGFMV